MGFQAKNGRIRMDNTYMDYVTFGSGKKNLIMIPGVGDGLKTVRGMALPFALLYREYAKDYRVFVLSRKQKLEKGCTTRMMAKDVARAMRALGIKKADIIGISQGGMIAQFLAVDYPGLVNKLVLVSTIAKAGPRIKRRVLGWIELAKKDDFEGLMLNIMEKMYSQDYMRRNGRFCPLAGRLVSGADKERFSIMARACATHNALSGLDKIRAKTLVIGGARDRVVGFVGIKELAEGVPGCEFILYENGEHGIYDEEKNFSRTVLEFLGR